MGLFTSKSRTEQALDQARKQLDRLDIDLDVDDLQKKARSQAGKQWDRLDFDVDDVQKRMKDIPLPRRHYEEPESSSAGFIAGVAVGVILGAVLAYLFGKQGGSDMVNQFAHRAEGLKETATEKYHQVRDRAEDEAGAANDGLGDGPAIEREFDNSRDDLDRAAEAAVERAKGSTDDLRQ